MQMPVSLLLILVQLEANLMVVYINMEVWLTFAHPPTFLHIVQLWDRENILYFLIGDEAFALGEHMMKPYPHRSAFGDKKVYNYRLSRARRIVENSFGIMCGRFRILLRKMELDMENAIQVTRACVILHNHVLKKRDQHYSPPGFADTDDDTVTGNRVPGKWR